MTDTPSPRPRRALSPAARSLRLQRIFARLQDGASYADIAAGEGFSRERLRQIVRAATAGLRLRRAGAKTGGGDALGRSAAEPPECHCQASKGLKTLKTARAGYWLKL